MVGALEQEEENYRSRLFHFQGMKENKTRHVKSMSVDQCTSSANLSVPDDTATSRSQGAAPLDESSLDQPICSSLHKAAEKGPKSRLTKEEPKEKNSGKNLRFLRICLLRAKKSII